MRRWMVPGLMTLVLASPLAAQGGMGRVGQQGQGMGEGMGAMAAIRGFAPGLLLEHREDLSLSSDQVERLEFLAAEVDSIGQIAAAAHEQHRARMLAALSAEEPELDVVLAHMTGAHDAMGLKHRAEISAALRARAVLSPEQRDEASDLAPHQGMGQGGGGHRQHGRN